MKLKNNNFVIYSYNLLAKGLKEITFTQNISLLFKHHNNYKAIASATIWNYYVTYKLKHKSINKSINFTINLFAHAGNFSATCLSYSIIKQQQLQN